MPSHEVPKYRGNQKIRANGRAANRGGFADRKTNIWLASDWDPYFHPDNEDGPLAFLCIAHVCTCSPLNQKTRLQPRSRFPGCTCMQVFVCCPLSDSKRMCSCNPCCVKVTGRTWTRRPKPMRNTRSWKKRGPFSSNEESTHVIGLNISSGEAKLVSRVETPNLNQLKRIGMNPTISRVLKMTREVAREQETARRAQA